MVFWDWIALLTGVLGVVLTIKQKIWCWPIALISVVISIVTFYKEHLYGDMFLNVFYFFSGIYGWFYWNKRKEEMFVVSVMPVKFYLPLIAITVFQIVFYYYILSYFNSDKIIFDSVLTACSFTCTYMMTKKWIENWLFWLVIDSAYVVLYIMKDMHVYALLYLFFSVMVLFGYFKWKKQILK